MAKKVSSTYYIGNIPIYIGLHSGAHTQNGCSFNLNIRVKPEVNTIGFVIYRTSDPLIHSLDNTTMAPNFELDLSNLCKLISLIKHRTLHNPTIQNTNQFIKMGVTSLSKYAEKMKPIWAKIDENLLVLILENNGTSEQYLIEGGYQLEYLLEVLIAAKDLFIQAKCIEENKREEVPMAPATGYNPPAMQNYGAPTYPQTYSNPIYPQPMSAPSTMAVPSVPTILTIPTIPTIPNNQ